MTARAVSRGTTTGKQKVQEQKVNADDGDPGAVGAALIVLSAVLGAVVFWVSIMRNGWQLVTDISRLV